MSAKPEVTVEGALSVVRVTVARALAAAYINGCGGAAEEDRPLTQVQRTDMLVAHIMAYDETVLAAEQIEAEAKLISNLEIARRGVANQVGTRAVDVDGP